ncbi:Transcription factor CPH1 [Cucumispora dikerogammari]|nr:Transcription factor CPH1 [Cucumispora dikerogammari]
MTKNLKVPKILVQETKNEFKHNNSHVLKPDTSDTYLFEVCKQLYKSSVFEKQSDSKKIKGTDIENRKDGFQERENIKQNETKEIPEIQLSKEIHVQNTLNNYTMLEENHKIFHMKPEHFNDDMVNISEENVNLSKDIPDFLETKVHDYRRPQNYISSRNNYQQDYNSVPCDNVSDYGNHEYINNNESFSNYNTYEPNNISRYAGYLSEDMFPIDIHYGYNIPYSVNYNERHNISYSEPYNGASNEIYNRIYNQVYNEPYNGDPNANYNRNFNQVYNNPYNQQNNCPVPSNVADDFISTLIKNTQYTYYNNSKFNLVEIQEKNYNYILKKYNEMKNISLLTKPKEIPFLYKGLYKENNDLKLKEWMKNAPYLSNKYKENTNYVSTYTLLSSEDVHCVLYENSCFITGTDIVKIIIWYLNSTGCFISNLKKFEEGIFSDLRGLKVGVDSILEPPRSKFLDFLYKNGCVRTQKKQKVFKYTAVNINKIYKDSLDRELRRGNGVFSNLCFSEIVAYKSKLRESGDDKELHVIDDEQRHFMERVDFETNIIKPKNLSEMYAKLVRRPEEKSENIYGMSTEYSDLLSREEDTSFFKEF